MNNLTNEQIAAIREAQVKAASTGFAQSLINHGFTEDMAKNATTLYVSEGGLLHKRASRIAELKEGIMQKVANLRKAK